MSLAQRHLPLRPPPETWGDSEFQHRRGIAIPSPFGASNRAASSKQARFIRHWRRFACFPHTPLKRPDQGACGPPILDFTPGGGTAAEREAVPFVEHPESKSAVRHAAADYLCSVNVKRTRQETIK